MGAGQIGGIATLLDIDFKNAAGFSGHKADVTEAHFIVYFLSHTMLFCTGALIEAHVVLAPASCVFGEKYKFKVFAGTHTFTEHSGHSQIVEHMGIHRGYNHTGRWISCSPDNLALLVLNNQYSFQKRESGTEYVLNRLRYGAAPAGLTLARNRLAQNCKFYGWGSRRNGYLIPLLINLHRVDVTLLPATDCIQMWNYDDKYLCMQRQQCKTDIHGALCPDDMGSVVVCNGFLRGIMTSRLMDRPCGVGFLDMSKYIKFLTCGVDDARDIINHDDIAEFEFEYSTVSHPPTASVITPEPIYVNPYESAEDVDEPPHGRGRD